MSTAVAYTDPPAVTAGRPAESQVMVGVASIPERERSLEQVIAALAPQADRVCVSLNEYDEVPAFLVAYANVEATLRGPAGGDAEKFASVDGWDGYVVTCDDDIGYPPDYIEQIVAGVERYSRRAAVSFHGGKTLGWNGSAVAASHKRIRCLERQPHDDRDVNVLGTGAMAYHAAHVPVWRSVFRHANMADVQFAVHARTMGVPMVGLQHERRWMRDICPPAGRRIYESNRDRDGSFCDTAQLRETEIRRFDWTTPTPARPSVRVSVATCGRPDKLLELLADLQREERWVDLEVAVFEDPKPGVDYTAAHRLVNRLGWVWRRFPRHLGRARHWQLVHAELRACGRSTADWFVFLPDDVRLVRHAIPRAITTWGLLDDPGTLTLWRLQGLEGKTNWTGRRPVPHEHATETFHVDGLYLAKRPTLKALGFGMVDPRFKHATGSGVGKAISRTLLAKGKRMYRVDESLATSNDGGVSIMHPEERIRNPAVTI